MLNITNIPAPRVSIIDERTGLISREWYRFFLNLFTLVGQGNNPTSLDDIQVGPPSQQINVLVASNITDQAPPSVPFVSVADNQALAPPSTPFVQIADNQALAPPSTPFVQIADNQALAPTFIQLSIPNYADLLPPVIPTTASSGTVTSVDVSGGSTGVTFSGGPITTSGTITMAGTLAVANGGTGATSTPTNGQLLIGNGSNYTPANLTAGTNITITNGSGTITISATGGSGSVTSVDGSGGSTGLTLTGGPITTSGTLTLGGTLAVASGGTGSTTLDGAGIVTKTGAQTISGQKTFTSLTNQFLGLTYATSDGSTSNAYLGENSAYATVAGVNGVVLGSGTTYPGFGRVVVDTNGIRPFTDNTYSCGNLTWRWSNVVTYDLIVSNKITSGTWNGSTIGIGYGGTGVTSTPSNGQLLIGNGSGYSLSTLTAGTNISISNSSGGITISSTGGSGTVTSVSGSGGSTGLTLTGGPITTSGTLTLGGTLAVANGGTGLTSTPSNGQIDIGNGSGFTRTTLTAGTGVSISNGSGSITINATNNGTVTSVSGSGGTTGLTLTGGPITTSGTLTLGGTLAAASGGTGASSLTGAGIVTTTDTQTVSGVKTFSSTSNQFVGSSYKTSTGYFYGDGIIGGSTGVLLVYGAYPGTAIFSGDNGTWRPTDDNTRALGTGVHRYTTVYAVTGTINTSDANQKQQIRELSDAEQRTAQRVKKLIRAFKWNDAVETKGEEARIHFGIIAQDVQEAFALEGLDASKYGLFCSDTWTTSDGSSQTRLGVRYSELLAFIIAAL